MIAAGARLLFDLNQWIGRERRARQMKQINKKIGDLYVRILVRSV
jgi:hypothetical protein